MKWGLHKLTIKLAIVLLSFVLACYIEIKPQWQKLLEEHQQQAQLKLQINTAMTLLKNRQQITAQWQTFCKALSCVQRLDDLSIVTAEILMAILHATEVNGLIMHSMQPKTVIVSDGTHLQTIHVEVTGSFLQFVNFNAMLARYALPLVLMNAKIKQLPGSDISIEMDIQGHFFVTSTVGIMSAPAWKSFPPLFLSQDVRNPFMFVEGSDDQEISVKALLTVVPLHQLKWVGYLHHNKDFWALVMLPNGKTILAKAQMEVGLEKAKIIMLSEKEIVVLLHEQSMHLKYGV